MEQALGKIDEQAIKAHLAGRLGYLRPEVQTGPGFGVDTAVIQLPGGMGMALSSDPLSLIPELGMQESAWLSVQLMVNDMATTGFAPMYGQFVLNLPPENAGADFENYWQHLHLYCKKNGIHITGGHTGFIPGCDATIAGGGTLITLAPLPRIRVSANASAGEVILVSKGAAMSSAAILALRFPRFTRKHLGKEIQLEAAGSFYDISVLKEGLIASGQSNQQADDGAVRAMHDVTEGGVLGAIYELARASGNGAHIHWEKLPVAPAQKAVCDLFGLDPMHCIGAGSMIMTCRPQAVETVLERMKQAGIPCREVGVLTPRESGMKLFRDGKQIPWTYSGTDPYWAAYYKAAAKGLD